MREIIIIIIIYLRFIFEQSDFAAGHVEPLLFGLREKHTLINSELRVVNKWISCIILRGLHNAHVSDNIRDDDDKRTLVDFFLAL